MAASCFRCLGSFTRILIPPLWMKPTTVVRCLAVTGASTSSKPRERARHPYMIFVSDKYKDLMQANPGVKVTDLGRMLGRMWRLLPDDQKEAYRERYHDEKEVCDARRQAMLDTLTKEEQKALEADEIAKKQDRKQLRATRRRKLLERSNDKPKAVGTSAFMLFMMSEPMPRGDAPVTMYVKGVSEMWKKMPEDDKEPFVNEAKDNRYIYRARLADWEQRMLKEGHPELVRMKVLTAAARRTRKTPTTAAETSVAKSKTSKKQPTRGAEE